MQNCDKCSFIGTAFCDKNRPECNEERTIAVYFVEWHGLTLSDIVDFAMQHRAAEFKHPETSIKIFEEDNFEGQED